MSLCSKRFLKVAIWVASFSCLCPSASSAAPPLQPVPIQAALVKTLQADRIAVGDSVLAKVSVGWNDPQCALRQGAILEGRVVAAKAHSKASKPSELALLFESGQCGGRAMKPLPLTLAAVVAPAPDTNEGLYQGDETLPLSSAPGLGIGDVNNVGPALGGNSAGGMRSVQAAAATVFSMAPGPRLPQKVMPGQVIGLKGINLSVGLGPQGSSVLSSAKRNVRLAAGSLLVLVLRPNAPPSPPSAPVAASPFSSSTAAAPAKSIPEPTPIPDETEICAPPHCSLALESNETSTRNARAAAIFSVKELGYPPKPTFEMHQLDFEAAISYLGAKELLFSFNPHQMVPRSGLEGEGQTVRIIRGALIDLGSLKVEKVVDWRVQDRGRYLWAAGRDRLLIHSGSELRLYGPGLKLQEKLSLGGPLAFVRVSPSGTYIAVGVVHERHTPAIHRELAEEENREPEEDVQVRVLNAKLGVLTTVMRSSWQPPPVLLDEGEIRLSSGGKNRWRVLEYDWTSQQRLLARFDSSCVPQAASLPPDLLFVVGCDSRTSGKWYRVLRPDGKLVLKGWSSAEDLDQIVAGSEQGETFAVAVARAGHALTPDSVFHAADLQSEYIGVYRTENGKRMFGVTVPSPPPTQQTFSLSPGGEKLAVFGADQISIYDVPGVVAARK